MKKILFLTIVSLLLFTIYGSTNLSILDFQQKNVCPKVLGIPACYIVLAFFVLTLAGHIFSSYLNKDTLYFLFLAVPLLFALGGTLTELSGKVVCPRTPGGTPMCYISLAMCLTLVVLKLAESRIA